jgi:hypothetical protein
MFVEASVRFAATEAPDPFRWRFSLTPSALYVLVLFVFELLDMTEDDARGLCELAAVDLRVAKGFAERALAEEDPDAANGLARTYQRAARSYRQSLALKARLRRELMRDAREDRADLRGEAVRRTAVAKARVFSAVKTLIWNEREGEEAERLEDQLCELLDDDALVDDFAEAPIHRHVTCLATDLGLTVAAELDPEKPPPPAGTPDREAVEGALPHPVVLTAQATPDPAWQSSA